MPTKIEYIKSGSKRALEKIVGSLLVISGLYLLVVLVLEYPALYESFSSGWSEPQGESSFVVAFVVMVTLDLLFVASRLALGFYMLRGVCLTHWQFYTAVALVLMGGGIEGISLAVGSVLLRHSHLLARFSEHKAFKDSDR